MKIRTGPITDLDLNESPSSLPSGAQLGTEIEVGGLTQGTGQFVLGRQNAACTQYFTCVANAGGYDFKLAVVADSADFDPMIAVSMATGADNDFTWFCQKHHEGTTYGSGSIVSVRTLAAAAADVILGVSGTSGALDDGVTTTQPTVDGVRLKTATGTAAAADNNTADFPYGMRFRERT